MSKKNKLTLTSLMIGILFPSISGLYLYHHNDESLINNTVIIDHVNEEPKYSPNLSSYYSGIDFSLTGNTLKKDLRELLIDTHDTYTSYDSLKTHFNTTDINPDTGKLILFYTGDEYASYTAAGANREHVWPKQGGKAFPESSGPGSDLHHLRPTNQKVNSCRSSLNFDVVTSGKSVTSGNGETCYYDSEFFYPGKGFRGQTARILMYLQTRWGGQYNLKFVDSKGYSKTIGKISTLMQWHLDEPVTDQERYRNEQTYKIQGNRNPYIDYPDLAGQVYCYDGESYNSTLKDIFEEQEPVELNSISLSPSNVVMAVGSTQTLSVTYNPANATNKNLTWTSSNSSVASVDSNGVVTSNKVGNAVITATSKENSAIKASANITVNRVTSISLSGDPYKTLYIEGETFNPAGLTINATYSDNTLGTISPSSLTWVDGLTRKSTLSNGTTSVIGLLDEFEVKYEGITVSKPLVSSNSFTKVSSSSDLVDGMEFIIGAPSKGIISGEFNDKYLEDVKATFTNDGTYIEDGSSGHKLTLVASTTSGYWNIKYDDTNYLHGGKKSLSLSTTKFDWKISDNGIISNGDSSNYTIQYNNSAPRFVPYDSSQVAAFVYKANVVEDTDLFTDGDNWVTSFLTETGKVCDVNGGTNYTELSNIWTELEASYSELDVANKNYIIGEKNDKNVECVNRYTYIISKYHNLNNFMSLERIDFAIQGVIDISVSKGLLTTTIIVISVVAIASLSLYLAFRKKNQ